MNQTTQQTLRFLQPEILSKIANLELLARTVVEGFISGLHRSPYKGFSVEFMEYRPYVPGDDPKRLDWKLFARTDRLFVKEFEDETNTTCHLLLDRSNSMAFSRSGITKLDYASYLAASLSYLMIRQRDSVGFCLFDHQVKDILPPRSTTGHLHSILQRLNDLQAGEQTGMGRPFHELADRIKKRGMVIIISDFLDDVAAIIDGLKHFVFNGHDVILFHVLDPCEVEFQFDDLIELQDMETGEKYLVLADEARAIYQKRFQEHQEKLSRETGLMGIDFKLLVTDRPLDFALFEYLSARARVG